MKSFFLLKSLCRFWGHRPNRDRCWWDQVNWRSNCTRCQAEMLKAENGWREFADADNSEHRITKKQAKMSRK